MKMVSIRNWARWQSYRGDRGLPPWIKLHRSLLRNVDWIRLTDSEKGQLVSMWILAAEYGGKIPNDPELVRRLCCMEKLPDFKLFKDNGFLDFDVKATSKRRQDDVNMTHSETDGDGDLEESPLTPLAGGDAAAPRRTKAGIASQAQEVVKALNEITGRSFSLDRGNGAIEAVLRGGATVAECREVLAFCWAKWYLDPKMVKFVNKVTPFRKSHFDAYLDESRAGAASAKAPEVQIPEATRQFLARLRANTEAELNGQHDEQ